MSVTQRELAEKLGLSQRAVAFALSDSGHARKQLRPETRARVQAAARQAGDRTNCLARGLKSRKTNTIGLVARNLNHPEESALNDQILRRIKAQEFETLVTVVPSFVDTRAIQDLFYGHRPEGMLLGPLYGDRPDAFLLGLARQGFPLVGFENDRDLPFDQVTQDRRVTHVLAINHLAELGHRRIGFVGLLAPDPTFEKTARELAGDRFGGVYLGHDTFDFENGLRFARSLRVGPGEPTAYLLYDTRFAAGFIRGARDRGLRIPEDVAITVHGCCEWGGYLPVTLTTIYADLGELADNIVRRLLERLRGNTTGARQRVLVPPRLKVGESTVGRKGGQGSAIRRQATGSN